MDTHHVVHSESALDLLSKEVTEPGLWQQRKHEIKAVEEQAGAPVICVPWLNRGTNFSEEERQQLRLEGLLPPVVEDLELQAERLVCWHGWGASHLQGG
jgi:hypothetical protein